MAEEIKFPRLSEEDIGVLVRGMEIHHKLSKALFLIHNKIGGVNYLHVVNNVLQGNPGDSMIHALTTYMQLLSQYPDFARAEKTTNEGYFPDIHLGNIKEEIYEMAERLKARQ